MSIFDNLDITQEEATNVAQQINKTGNRDGRICICGHAIGYHEFIEARGRHKCKAQKQTCPCKNPRAVIETNNARAFMRKTHGSAGLHALTQGIVKAIELGATVEWTIETACDKCGQNKPVVPCPVTQSGQIAPEATGWDKLMCRECRSGH